MAQTMKAYRFNRQLHPEEKTLAKQIADKSGGMYTQAQVEDQLRVMGVGVGDTHQSGAPDTLIGQAPTDSGARWILAGTTADGQPILTKITAQPDPALQSYIRANFNSVSSGGVPSEYTYDVPTGGGSSTVTGPFTKFDKGDGDFMRNTTADTAGFAATQFDRAAALATGLATEQLVHCWFVHWRWHRRRGSLGHDKWGEESYGA